MAEAKTTGTWLDQDAAGEYIGVQGRTLADWRLHGRGPAYSAVGRKLVRYNIADLDAWLMAHRVEVSPAQGVA